jgi:hypothetical protein
LPAECRFCHVGGEPYFRRRNYDRGVLYRRLADLVLACHALVVVVFLFGGVLSWRYPWVALFHVPLAAWVAAVFIMDWTCPLTPLENHLRRAAGEKGYEGGFVDHYLMPFLARPNAKGSTRQEEIALGVLFGGVSFAVHAVNFVQYRDALGRLAG